MQHQLDPLATHNNNGYYMNTSSPRHYNTATTASAYYVDNGYTGTAYQGLDPAYQGIDPAYQGLDPAYQGLDPTYQGLDAAPSHARGYRCIDTDMNNNNNSNTASNSNIDDINNNNNNSSNNRTGVPLVVNFKQEPLDSEEIEYQNNSMKLGFNQQVNN